MSEELKTIETILKVQEARMQRRVEELEKRLNDRVDLLVISLQDRISRLVSELQDFKSETRSNIATLKKIEEMRWRTAALELNEIRKGQDAK